MGVDRNGTEEVWAVNHVFEGLVLMKILSFLTFSRKTACETLL
jgi:hypothetical protein